MQVISKQGQWLGDIAIREAGSIEAVVEMAVINDISITDTNIPSTLKRPKVLNKRIAEYYKINNIYPATYAKLKESFGGIGFMAIGLTFKINGDG